MELAAARRRGKTALGEGRLGAGQCDEALRQQALEVHGLAVGLAAKLLVRVFEAWLCETHVPCQVAKDLCIAARLALRRNRRAVEQHVGVAVGQVHVPVFELRGRRQDVVGPVGRIGLEMLQHHGEQVLARETLHHLRRVGRHGDRVAVVDHQGFDLRAKGGRGRAQQIVANGHHVDGAWRAPGQQVGALQHGPLHREGARAGQQQPARALAPRTGERGQAGHGAHGVGAAVRTLHAVVQANGGGLGGAPVLRQLTDLRHGQAADRSGPLGRPLQGARAQGLPAQGVARDVVVIQPIVHDQLVHQRQRQRRIGAGQQLQVLMAFVRSLGAARVDAHQACPRALGLLGITPEMQVAANRIAPPDHDEARLGEELHAHAHLAAQRVHQALAARRGANGARQLRGAEAVEKAPVHALALYQPHGAGVAVGQDGLRVARGDLAQARGDAGQRFVP